MRKTKKLTLFLSVLCAFVPSLAFAGGTGIGCNYTIKQEADKYHFTLTLKGPFQVDAQHPQNRNALAFIVFDERGNLVQPYFYAKVDPKNQILPGGTPIHTHTLSSDASLAFPFITGTGALAYKLDPKARYRVVVVYRWNQLRHDGYTCGGEWILDNQYHGIK